MPIRERELGHQFRAVKRGTLYRDDLERLLALFDGLPGSERPIINCGDFEMDTVDDLGRLESVSEIEIRVRTPLESRYRAASLKLDPNSDRAYVSWDDRGPDDWRAAAELADEALTDTRSWVLEWSSRLSIWFMLIFVGGGLYFVGESPEEKVVGALLWWLLMAIQITNFFAQRRGKRIILDEDRAFGRGWPAVRGWVIRHSLALTLWTLSIVITVLASWYFGR